MCTINQIDPHNTIKSLTASIYIRIPAIAFMLLSLCVSLCFGQAQQDQQAGLALPKPGQMIEPSRPYMPPTLKGIRLYPDDPLRLDFILDMGQAQLTPGEVEQESAKLIKYFLASLTVPSDELWVNLSPYEKDRTIPDKFGITEMGRDLLAQDYILKQLTASLIYPEDDLGRNFWDTIYQKMQDIFDTSEIPVNTFNKVWIVPDKAVVHQAQDVALLVDSHLDVMLEQDYLSLRENSSNQRLGTTQLDPGAVDQVSQAASEIVKDLILPVIEKEVNTGQNFANLRQIYSAMVLAVWFKKNLQENFINRIYTDQNKTGGIEIDDKDVKKKILAQYLEAFKTGVYNYIREDYDAHTHAIIPRRYYSGGFEGKVIERILIGRQVSDLELYQTAQEQQGGAYRTVSVMLNPVKSLDNLVAILKAVGQSGMLENISDQDSEAEILTALIEYFKGRQRAAEPWVTEESDSEQNLIMTLNDRLKDTPIGRALVQYVMNGDTGVKAINYQGADGIWRIVGFESELPAQLEREQNEVRYRKQGWSALEAYNQVLEDEGDTSGQVDIATAQQAGLVSAQREALIAASIQVTPDAGLLDELKDFQPRQRIVTELGLGNEPFIRDALIAQFGKIDQNVIKTKSFRDLPVEVMFNPERNRFARQEYWQRMTRLSHNHCSLCGHLNINEDNKLDVGYGFSVVKEAFPYFNNSFSVISNEHERPQINANLIKSMAQMLWELGPMGYRIGYNHRGISPRLVHQSYKVFQQEMPIEGVASKLLLRKPGIDISIIDTFPYNAFMFETERYDLLAYELQNMEKMFKLLEIPFYLLMSRTPEGKYRTYVILRSAKAPMSEEFDNKIFGFSEAAGLVLLDLEEFFERHSLKPDLISSYKDIDLDKYYMEQLGYIYKIHNAMAAFALKHNLTYEFDRTGGLYYTFRIPALGEVVKYFYFPTPSMDEEAMQWDEYFQEGYELARKYLGGIFVPMQNVGINEQGDFIALEAQKAPVYLVQKIAPDGNMAQKLDRLLQEEHPSIDAIIKVHEDFIRFKGRMMAAGVYDTDYKNFMANVRGLENFIGYDISHIADLLKGIPNFMEQIHDFEQQFDKNINNLGRQHPQVFHALKARFGNLHLLDELKKLGLRMPQNEAGRIAQPMEIYDSHFMKLVRGEPVQLLSEETIQEMSEVAAAPTTGEPNKGGIDLNPELLELETRGEAFEFKAPYDASIYQDIPIRGLDPVIFQIVPTNLPAMLHLSQK